MKNIIPALLSIIVGFALSSFALNMYLSNTIKKDKPKITIQKTEITKKEIPAKRGTGKTTEVEISKRKIPTESVTINLNNIQESFDNWNAYMKENIDLMSTFKPLDEKGVIMKKGMFLTSLRTGAYIPIKSEKDGEIQYQLNNIENSASEKIKKSIMSKATIAHKYFKMEGRKLPSYDFVDLKGKSYNKEDTKGKIVVLKCWFITCKICVEEFPQLNALVDKYQNDNIEFVSLAFDEKDKLVEFLKTKPFKYVTIPNQKKYMSKKLKVKQYPTHLIVDSKGVILKMVNNVKTLTSELKNVLGK